MAGRWRTIKVNKDRTPIAALGATVEKRGSKKVLKDYRKIMDAVKNSEIMQKQWDNYRKDFEYASDIEFGDVCAVVVKLMDNLL